MKTLILGAVRSGKSRYAETLSVDLSRKAQSRLIYIATSHPNDDEMQKRVNEHQTQRKLSGENWVTVEETLYLADILKDLSTPKTTILIDCLTLWMTNLLCHKDIHLLKIETQKVLNTLTEVKGDIVFVSNETGLGIVPENKLSRDFIEEMGLFHQSLAAACDQVSFVVAGLPITLKASKDDRQC